jgi:hypothetical protein
MTCGSPSVTAVSTATRSMDNPTFIAIENAFFAVLALVVGCLFLCWVPRNFPDGRAEDDVWTALRKYMRRDDAVPNLETGAIRSVGIFRQQPLRQQQAALRPNVVLTPFAFYQPFRHDFTREFVLWSSLT